MGVRAHARAIPNKGRRLDVLAGLVALLGLGREELRLDLRQDTTLRDDDVAEQLVELLVVADGKLCSRGQQRCSEHERKRGRTEVAGDDTRLLVVTGGIAGELENLSGQVLEHGREVDGRAGTDTLGVVATAEETVDTTCKS